MPRTAPARGRNSTCSVLAGAYAYPRDAWLRANFVASADGAAYVDGLSGGLSSADDKRVFGILRVLADVILVGAGTARAEGYKPARRRDSLAALREGRTAAPPIALVTRTLGLNLSSSLFADAPRDARTMVFTCAAADQELRAETAKVADLIVVGDEAVDLPGAVAALAERGLTRVLCEGGPTLFGDLSAAGLVDELCLSLSPTLAGPGAGRIISGEHADARPLALRQVIAGRRRLPVLPLLRRRSRS